MRRGSNRRKIDWKTVLIKRGSDNGSVGDESSVGGGTPTVGVDWRSLRWCGDAFGCFRVEENEEGKLALMVVKTLKKCVVPA
jgi:hypothetical protein